MKNQLFFYVAILCLYSKMHFFAHVLAGKHIFNKFPTYEIQWKRPWTYQNLNFLCFRWVFSLLLNLRLVVHEHCFLKTNAPIERTWCSFSRALRGRRGTSRTFFPTTIALLQCHCFVMAWSAWFQNVVSSSNWAGNWVRVRQGAL